MKRIAMSMFTIFAMVAVVAGGTSAAFTSTATVEGNTISTANLDVEITQEHVIDTQNLVPGETPGTRYASHVTNNSDVPVTVHMHLEVADTNECEQVEFNRVQSAYNDSGWGQFITLHNNIPVNDLNGVGNSTQLGGRNSVDVLNPGDFFRVAFQPQLSADADDDNQGQTCEFDIVFIGESL